MQVSSEGLEDPESAVFDQQPDSSHETNRLQDDGQHHRAAPQMQDTHENEDGEEEAVEECERQMNVEVADDGQDEEVAGTEGHESGKEYILLFHNNDMVQLHTYELVEGQGEEVIAGGEDGVVESIAAVEEGKDDERSQEVCEMSTTVATCSTLEEAPQQVTVDGQIRFKCDQCAYVCKKKSYMKVHKTKVHYMPKAVMCHLCQASCITTAALYIHMGQVHSEELPFACEICGYRSRSRHRITAHKMSHDKEPRYKCAVCEFATRHKYLHTQHMYTHQDEKPFWCSMCGYKAKWRSSVYMHIRKVHGQDMSGHEEYD